MHPFYLYTKFLKEKTPRVEIKKDLDDNRHVLCFGQPGVATKQNFQDVILGICFIFRSPSSLLIGENPIDKGGVIIKPMMRVMTGCLALTCSCLKKCRLVSITANLVIKINLSLSIVSIPSVRNSTKLLALCK